MSPLQYRFTTKENAEAFAKSVILPPVDYSKAIKPYLDNKDWTASMNPEWIKAKFEFQLVEL